MLNIRSPLEKLAGCYHLARFTDKIRLHLAGDLPADYQLPLFHQHGVDGFFMNHFGLGKDELLAMVKASNNDAEVCAWFESRIGHDDRKKEDWNAFSVNLGKPGHPMNKALAWARKTYNSQCTDPSIDSVFLSIEWDEGRLPR